MGCSIKPGVHEYSANFSEALKGDERKDQRGGLDNLGKLLGDEYLKERA